MSPAVPLAAPRTATPPGSITNPCPLTPHGVVGDGFISVAADRRHDRLGVSGWGSAARGQPAPCWLTRDPPPTPRARPAERPRPAPPPPPTPPPHSSPQPPPP